MKNLKKGDLVQLKNGDKKEIYGIFGVYKQSSDEYTYELITLDRYILEDDEYTNSDLIKYNFTIEDDKLNKRLTFNYKEVINKLDDCNLIINNFKDEQREIINHIIDKYGHESTYASNIFDIINETATRNNQTMIEFTSKYVPYILSTINDLKFKNTHLKVDELINDGLMMHLYYTMEENKSILYKRMLLNKVIYHLNKMQEIDIFGFINNIDEYTGDYANVFLTMNPDKVLLYIDEYLKEMIEIPFTETFKLEKKLNEFLHFLKEKTK